MATISDLTADYGNCRPFADVHPNFPLDALPDWIRENIDNARVYGGGLKGVVLADGRKYHLDNCLNDMNGRDWTMFINSVFGTAYPTKGAEGYAHEIRRVHPSPKPPQLMRDLIQFFTKSGGLVFDCFAGVGGTLLGAALCGRTAAGIELNPNFIGAYRKAAVSLGLAEFPVEVGDALEILTDSRKMAALTNDRPIDLMLIDPPYTNMMSRKKTGGDIAVYGENATPFTDNERDLGNMPRDKSLDALKRAVELTLPHIKFRGYIVVFIKDLQPQKKQINFLHAEVVEKLNEIPNIYYKGMKIWVDQTTKPYPYGYPFCFVANQTHQYILVFRKER